MNEPTREEKIKKIYEVIADKTLSFGCLIEFPKNNICVVKWASEHRIEVESLSIINKTIWSSWLYKDNKENSVLSKYKKIIWHPVMIWDCLDWIEKNWTWKDSCEICWTKWPEIHLLQLWKKKWQQIEEQSDECIAFIYSLIHNGE